MIQKLGFINSLDLPSLKFITVMAKTINLIFLTFISIFMLETINEFNSRRNAASNLRTYSVLEIKIK